jgi:hypothetical protein
LTTRTATHHQHSTDYYYYLIKALISLVNRRFTQKAIASALNAEGITSPTGGTFNAKKVANTLSRLRHHDKHRSLLYQGMLTLCCDGRLTLTECMPLLHYEKVPALRGPASSRSIKRSPCGPRERAGRPAKHDDWRMARVADTAPQLPLPVAFSLCESPDATAPVAAHRWLPHHTGTSDARTHHA